MFICNLYFWCFYENQAHNPNRNDQENALFGRFRPQNLPGHPKLLPSNSQLASCYIHVFKVITLHVACNLNQRKDLLPHTCILIFCYM